MCLVCHSTHACLVSTHQPISCLQFAASPETSSSIILDRAKCFHVRLAGRPLNFTRRQALQNPYIGASTIRMPRRQKYHMPYTQQWYGMCRNSP